MNFFQKWLPIPPLFSPQGDLIWAERTNRLPGGRNKNSTEMVCAVLLRLTNMKDKDRILLSVRAKKILKKGKNSRIQPSSTIQSTNFLPSKKPHLVNREALLPLMEALAGLKINRQILVK